MIINGKLIAASIEQQLTTSIVELQERPPCLAVLLVGDHPPSHVYVGRKVQSCKRVGIRSILHQLPATASQEVIIEILQTLNKDDLVDGILIQLPLPLHINTSEVIRNIDPSKDVDGLHPMNAGKLLIGDPSGFVPCTPLGIQALLEYSKISTVGKHVVILGRSNLVGKPLAALLMQNNAKANATVTLAHSQTQDLKKICLTADILIAAIGQPEFVTVDMVRPDAYVIDVGINKIDQKIVGDVAFQQVKEHCAGITPVPGGVGPMTIAMLLTNTLKSYLNHRDHRLDLRLYH